MKYSLILPIYNEEETIPVLYKRLSEVLCVLEGGGDCEIIFINDGSVDGSLSVLKKLHSKDKRVKIINFSRNFGHQTAVTAGLENVSGDLVAVMDADLQDPPEILRKFFAKLEEGYDVVYAIRTRRKEGWHKVSMYKFFYRLLQTFSSIAIPLDSGDFCVMSARAVKALNSLPERNRFVRGLRSWLGFKQIGIEYERDRRYAGKSKYPLIKLIKLALDGLFSFSYLPLRILTVFGFLTFLASVFGSLLAIYFKYFTDSYALVPGFATTIILISFMGGLNMLSIGLVGEYIARIYDEVKQRPNYIIESKIGFQ